MIEHIAIILPVAIILWIAYLIGDSIPYRHEKIIAIAFIIWVICITIIFITVLHWSYTVLFV